MLEINNMKTSYWFAALSPFVSAAVAFATAAAVMPGSGINSGRQPSAKIWDVC
jgi:hypothetical protein